MAIAKIDFLRFSLLIHMQINKDYTKCNESVSKTKTRPIHLVAFASLASIVLALPFDRKVSAPPEIAPDNPDLLPDCKRTTRVTVIAEISCIIVSAKVICLQFLSVLK